MMQRNINRILATVVFFVWTTAANADLPTSLMTAAETCRQAAIQLDWLSQFQVRKNCTVNLSDDALNVYYVSKYILANQLHDAQIVLRAAIVQTQYTIDVGCEGQASIQSILANLQNALQIIS